MKFCAVVIIALILCVLFLANETGKLGKHRSYWDGSMYVEEFHNSTLRARIDLANGETTELFLENYGCTSNMLTGWVMFYPLGENEDKKIIWCYSPHEYHNMTIWEEGDE